VARRSPSSFEEAALQVADLLSVGLRFDAIHITITN